MLNDDRVFWINALINDKVRSLRCVENLQRKGVFVEIAIAYPAYGDYPQRVVSGLNFKAPYAYVNKNPRKRPFFSMRCSAIDSGQTGRFWISINRLFDEGMSRFWNDCGSACPSSSGSKCFSND